MTDAPASMLALPRVELDGQENAGLGRDLLLAMVEETLDGLYRGEIVVNNFGITPGRDYGYLYFDRSLVEFGKEVTLRLGPASASPIFAGRITALEAEYPRGGGARLAILMEDRLQDLRMTRRTRSFEDLSDADIIQQVASDHSLTPDVTLDGPTHRSVTQVNQSDLAFIRERARVCGGELWVEGTTLYAKERTARLGDPLRLNYQADSLTFRVRADLAHQCTELAVSGWDVAAKEAIRETSGPGDVSNELASDTGGSAILQQAFGSRVASVVHTVPLTGQEAAAIASARYRERARRFVTGTCDADGNAQIRVGKRVEIDGLGVMFDGSYYVVRVRHTYSRQDGFRTEFDVERPGIGS